MGSVVRAMDVIRTVGHGTLSDVELGGLLEDAGADTLVDVRRYPASRRHPQFNAGEMERWLPERGIAYVWMEGLGGRRRGSPDSVNVGLRNDQFRAYADHMGSAEFRGAVEDLFQLASTSSVAVMCSESVWWRCHRRLLGDHLVLVEGRAVEHLLGGHSTVHPVTLGARRLGDRVVYESGEGFPARGGG